MARSVEYLLVSATVGAITMVVGSMSWAGLGKLAATLTQIAQVLQVNP